MSSRMNIEPRANGPTRGHIMLTPFRTAGGTDIDECADERHTHPTLLFLESPHAEPPNGSAFSRKPRKSTLSTSAPAQAAWRLQRWVRPPALGAPLHERPRNAGQRGLMVAA